jgi:hypothetical protein
MGGDTGHRVAPRIALEAPPLRSECPRQLGRVRQPGRERVPTYDRGDGVAGEPWPRVPGRAGLVADPAVPGDGPNAAVTPCRAGSAFHSCVARTRACRVLAAQNRIRQGVEHRRRAPVTGVDHGPQAPTSLRVASSANSLGLGARKALAIPDPGWRKTEP